MDEMRGWKIGNRSPGKSVPFQRALKKLFSFSFSLFIFFEKLKTDYNRTVRHLAPDNPPTG